MARRVSPRIMKRIVQGPRTHFKLEWGCLSIAPSKKIMDSEELDSRPHPSPTVAEKNQSFPPSKSPGVSNQKI